MVSLGTAHVQKMIKQLSQNIAADFVTPRLTATSGIVWHAVGTIATQNQRPRAVFRPL